MAERFPTEPSLAECVGQISSALEKKDFGAAQSAYEVGLELVKADEPGREVAWRAFYHRYRFRAGVAEALGELLILQSEEPAEPLLPYFIAKCYLDYEQYDEAVNHLERAAMLTEGETRVGYSLLLVHCLRKLKKYGEARAALINLAVQNSGRRRSEVLQALYEVMTESEGGYLAFGIAELVLHENPALSSFRFGVGLDYRKAEDLELFLQHYRTICDHEPDNPGALHNLGLALDECELPILSVSHYKKAFDLGNTMSANNLGYRYLNAGFADEALETLSKAQKVEKCVPEVQVCLGEVEERRCREPDKLAGILDDVGKRSAFLVKLGSAILAREIPAVEGTWRLKFGDIRLERSGAELKGTLRKEIEKRPGLFEFGLGFKPEPKKLTEEYGFRGRLHGRACRYQITKKTADPVAGLLGGGDTATTKGFLVFSEDGRVADAAELDHGKLSKFMEIAKVMGTGATSAS